MPKQTLCVLDDIFAIHSLSENSAIPSDVLSSEFYFVGKTKDELSLVVDQSIEIESNETDSDWRVMEVLGPLNLSMIGIMAQISKYLAEAKISIFVVSTFETDFIMVKNAQLNDATKALKSAGYDFQ